MLKSPLQDTVYYRALQTCDWTQTVYKLSLDDASQNWLLFWLEFQDGHHWESELNIFWCNPIDIFMQILFAETTNWLQNTLRFCFKFKKKCLKLLENFKAKLARFFFYWSEIQDGRHHMKPNRKMFHTSCLKL